MKMMSMVLFHLVHTIDNSLEYCIEPIDAYCSDSSFFEYYIDYSQSLDPYIGNIINDSECQHLFYLVVWMKLCLTGIL